MRSPRHKLSPITMERSCAKQDYCPGPTKEMSLETEFVYCSAPNDLGKLDLWKLDLGRDT